MATNYVYSLALNWNRGTLRKAVSAGEKPRPYTARPDLDRELGSMFQLADGQAGELLLVRHAEPDTEAQHHYCGDEPALTGTGRVQARYLAGRLTQAAIDAIYCAPERYAEETARIVGEALEVPLRTVPELADIEYTLEDSPRVGTIGGLFAANPRWDALPGFEPSTPFRRRAIQAIEALLASHGAQRIVVVTHASVINAYLSMLLDIPRDLFFYPDHASLSVVRWQGDGYAVRSLNDTNHLTTMGQRWQATPEV